MLLSQPLRPSPARLPRSRFLPALLCLAAWPRPLLAATADRTCGTDQNAACGLNGVLHALYITAGIMAVLFMLVLGLVIRYYIRTKHMTETREIDIE